MFFDILGWIGMILVLLAYALLSTNKVKNGKLYQSLNLIAVILMAIGLFPTKAWFSFALQIIWTLVAFIAIVKIIKKNEGFKLKNDTENKFHSFVNSKRTVF